MESGLEYHLNVKPDSSLPRYSDKAIFPPSILSSILDNYGEAKLPHPLVFKIYNNEKTSYVGVKEFSSQEGLIELPQIISEKLSIEKALLIRIELVRNIPKGQSLTLKTLQFYPQVHNWKFFLESKLTNFYTTLTKHEVLYIEDGNTVYELYIEAVDESLDTIGIIDTDITLDVIPLNDIMANQQLEFSKNTQFINSEEINEIQINDAIDIIDLKLVFANDFKPRIFKIDISNYNLTTPLMVKLTNFDNNDYSSIFNTDIIVGVDKLTNLENYRWTTMDQDFEIQYRLDRKEISKYEKLISINILNDDELLTKVNRSEDDISDHYLYVVPFTWEFSGDVKLSITKTEDTDDKDIVNDTNNNGTTEETATCSNCLKQIPKNKLVLHESFCMRNNIKCSCGSIFLREIPPTHWHCEKCADPKNYGNSSILKFKHDKLYHEVPYRCNQCSSTEEFSSFLDLVVNHKSSVCPGKLHECRFCFLIVPQGEATYHDKVENLTNHENACGNKTTECFKCNKILRSKDLAKHLKMHDLDKLQMNQQSKLFFNKCLNENCIVITKDNGTHNQMGLCDYCYGPLYIPQHDPTNSKLQSRIERKYMIQLSKGCGFDWCTNTKCKSANPDGFSGKSHKDLLHYINTSMFSQIHRPRLPINKSTHSDGPNRLWFCVNESIQMRRNLLHQLVLENEYDEELIYKPINELLHVDELSVRSWLLENGVKKT